MRPNCPALTATSALSPALSTDQLGEKFMPCPSCSAKRCCAGSMRTTTSFVRHPSPGAESSASPHSMPEVAARQRIADASVGAAAVQRAGATSARHHSRQTPFTRTESVSGAEDVNAGSTSASESANPNRTLRTSLTCASRRAAQVPSDLRWPLLSKSLPSSDFNSALRASITGGPTLAATLPDADRLRPILARALAPSPGDRYPSMGALLDALAPSTPGRR